MDSHAYGPAQAAELPFNIDALLHELSASRIAGSRPVSMSSTSHRSRMGKITKPGSAGSSPQNVQRRRTSASHRLAKYLSDLYPFSAYGQQLAPEPSYNAHGQQPMESTYAVRPLSWHPSGISHYDTNVSFAQQRASMAMATYQSVQRYGMPTPISGPEMGADLSFGDWSSLETPDYSSPPHTEYGCQPTTMPLQTDLGFVESRPMAASASRLPLRETQRAFSPSARSSGVWPSYQATTSATISAFPGPTSAPGLTAPPTPDMLPIQKPVEAQVMAVTTLDAEQDIGMDDGPELVGMGLYDTPIRQDFSHAGQEGGFLIMGAALEATGKGLKLEETWEPPEDNDEDDASSETSEDGLNEDDDEFQPPQTSQPSSMTAVQSVAPVQMTRLIMMEDDYHRESLQRMYGDISKQSFLIDGDETSINGRGDSMVLGPEVSQLWLRAMEAGDGVFA